MTVFSVIIGWCILLFSLWPSDFSWSDASALVLGAFLYTQVAGFVYGLAVVSPRRDATCASICIAASVLIAIALRKLPVPTDNPLFAGLWIVICVGFSLTVGRRMHQRAMSMVRLARGLPSLPLSSVSPQRMNKTEDRRSVGNRGRRMLGEFEVIGETKRGGMGEVTPVRSWNGEIFAAKTFQIFNEADTLLLAAPDVIDFGKIMKTLKYPDSRLGKEVSKLLREEEAIRIIIESWDGSKDLPSTKQAAVINSLNKVIGSAGDEELKAIMLEDNDIDTIEDDPRLQDLKEEPENMILRRFGRLAMERIFGDAIRHHQQLSTNVFRWLELFRKEAKRCLELGKHRNIVQAHRVIEIEGRPYILLEYVSGGSLRDYLRKRDQQGMPAQAHIPEALGFALQFCDGMMFVEHQVHASQTGVQFVHDDIKPENCLLTDDGMLKISDFGLSLIVGEVEDAADLGTVGGTEDGGDRRTSVIRRGAEYMAPERIIAGQKPDVRSDIYSFGVVFHELLHKDRPEGVEPDFSFLHDLFPEDQQKRDALASILGKCLARDPSRRYENFSDVAADLATLYESVTGKIFHFSDAGQPDSRREAFLDYANCGSSYLVLGYYEDAITWYRKALDIDSGNGLVWNNLGLAHQRFGRTSEAHECFKKAMDRDPGLAGPWIHEGIILEQRGDLTQALDCYRTALDRQPDSQERIGALNNMGNVYGRMAEFDQAITYFDRVLEIAPRYAQAWSNKGTALAHLERFDDALACFNRALDINPLLSDAWYCRGTTLRTQGKYPEALEALERAYKLNPKDQQARQDWEALRAFAQPEQVQTEQPGQEVEADADWYQGHEHEKLGELDAARKCYEEATKKNPRFFEAWFSLGNIHSEQRRFRDAIQCLDRAISEFDKAGLSGKHHQEVASRYWYNKASAHEDLGELDQAVRAYDEAIRRNPRKATALWNKGGVLAHMNRGREAADSMEQAINIDPKAAAGMPLREARQLIRSLRENH